MSTVGNWKQSGEEGIQISELLGQEGLDLRIILNGFNGLNRAK